MSARLVANVVTFQLGWFACVLGGAYGQPLPAVAVAAAICLAHVARASAPRDELVLILIAGGVGAACELTLLALGLLAYPAGHAELLGVPAWMIALWMLFATTANVSLRWLRERTALAIACGALGGPLAYFGGVQLGALEFTRPVASPVAVAVAWAVLFPVLLRFARHFDGYRPAPPAEVSHAGV